MDRIKLKNRFQLLSLVEVDEKGPEAQAHGDPKEPKNSVSPQVELIEVEGQGSQYSQYQRKANGNGRKNRKLIKIELPALPALPAPIPVPVQPTKPKLQFPNSASTNQLLSTLNNPKFKEFVPLALQNQSKEAKAKGSSPASGSSDDNDKSTTESDDSPPPSGSGGGSYNQNQRYGGIDGRSRRVISLERSAYKSYWNSIVSNLSKLNQEQVRKRIDFAHVKLSSPSAGSGSYKKLTSSLKEKYKEFTKKIFSVKLRHDSSSSPIYYFFDYLIVMDFEATCEGCNSTDFPHEIIQFPAVLLNVETREIVGEFNRFVRPTIRPILSDFCTELTGITQDMVNSAQTFPEVLAEFEAWLSALELGTRYNFSIVTDGSCDAGKFLYEQCLFSGIPYPSFATQWINIRRSYTELYRIPWCKLITTLDVLNEKFTGKQHNGLDDSRNITKVLISLLNHGANPVQNEKILLSWEEQERNPKQKLYDLVSVRRVSRLEFIENYKSVSGGGGCDSQSEDSISASASPDYHHPLQPHQLHQQPQLHYFSGSHPSSASGSPDLSIGSGYMMNNQVHGLPGHGHGPIPLSVPELQHHPQFQHPTYFWNGPSPPDVNMNLMNQCPPGQFTPIPISVSMSIPVSIPIMSIPQQHPIVVPSGYVNVNMVSSCLHHQPQHQHSAY